MLITSTTRVIEAQRKQTLHIKVPSTVFEEEIMEASIIKYHGNTCNIIYKYMKLVQQNIQ